MSLTDFNEVINEQYVTPLARCATIDPIAKQFVCVPRALQLKNAGTFKRWIEQQAEAGTGLKPARTILPSKQLDYIYEVVRKVNFGEEIPMHPSYLRDKRAFPTLQKLLLLRKVSG